jgi:hypothetical protein
MVCNPKRRSPIGQMRYLSSGKWRILRRLAAKAGLRIACVPGTENANHVARVSDLKWRRQ